MSTGTPTDTPIGTPTGTQNEPPIITPNYSTDSEQVGSPAPSSLSSQAGPIQSGQSGQSSTSSGPRFISNISTVESLVNTYRQSHSTAVPWISRVTTEGDFAFYNQQLDVYSSSIPLTTYKYATDTTLKLDMPSPSALLDTSIVSRQAYESDAQSIHSSHSHRSSHSQNSTHNHSRSPSGSGASSKDFDMKRDSNASLVDSNALTFYHQFSQPFFNMDGLFYNQPLDITRWSELGQQFNFLLELTHKALRDSNKQLFSTHFNRLNKLLSILFLATRLAQKDFNDGKYERSIRRKLKRIAGAYARIYTNGLLHLSVIHYGGEDEKFFDMGIHRLNKSMLPGDSVVGSTGSSLSTMEGPGPGGPGHSVLGTLGGGTSISTPGTPGTPGSTHSGGFPGLSTPGTPGTDGQAPPSSAPAPGSSASSSGPNSSPGLLYFQTIKNRLSELKESKGQSQSQSQGQGQAMGTDTTVPSGTMDSYFQQLDSDCQTLLANMKSLIKTFAKVTHDKRVHRKDYDNSDTSEDEGVDRSDILPQVYPRFLAGEFNGGNWCNPFFTKTNPVLNASGDDLKNRYHLKIIIDRDAYKSIFQFSEEMKKLSDQTLQYLDPEVQHNYFNEQLKGERNTQILRLIYKFLYYALLVIDMIEAFDFTVFCLIKREEEQNTRGSDGSDGADPTHKSNLTFDYPVVLEFFQSKQDLHHFILQIVMATQGLTLEDPEVFKGMKEDDPLLYNRDIMKQPNEKAAMLLINVLVEETSKLKGEAISLNPDAMMATSLSNGVKHVDQILTIIQQLIDERDTILNYATRVMHDDFNVQLLVIERNNTILSDKTEESSHYYSGKKSKSTDTPWYLEGDEEYDLLMDFKGSIKGGSKEALIAHLTHHDVYDTMFNSAFLVTFPTMMGCGQLIALLINRFNIEAPEGLSYEEYNLWISKKQNPIRLRVLNNMKLLVEKYWVDLYYHAGLLKRWLAFAQTPTVQSYSVGKTLANLLSRLSNGEVVRIERQPAISSTKRPAPLTKGSVMKKLKLLDIDYVELARQLTLREFKLYSKISMFACICKVWGRKSGLSESIETISAFIKASNQLTNYVAYMILRKQEPRKRVQLIRYWVQVAEKCRQLNNYSSMTAIILALYSSPIHRLKKTWKFVSPDTMAHLQNMNKLMNSTRNFNEYRDVLKFIGLEPCVPFFGVYLSDLTFAFHGNTEYLMNRPWMINFAKRSKTFEIVSAMDRFRSIGYNLQEVKEIQLYLESWFDKCPTIDEQYQLSLNLEPRETVKPGGNFKKK